MTDKTNERNTDKKGFSTLTVVHKAACILLVAAAVLIALCLVTDGMGALGGAIRNILRGLFSWGTVIIPIAMISQAVCYAEDLASKRFGKRSLFALVSAVLISCIDYAIFTWGTEPAFFPAQCFADMNGGGFIGGVMGFALAKLFGQLGVIIVSVAALAIYAVFFFAEKAGSVGQAALNFAAAIKGAITFVKNKRKAYVEKKKQIKADADQHQREVKSEELIDDEFFRAKGEASDVKIRQLGIEENATTHGTSPLVDPEKRIPEEPVVVAEESEARRRRADKPLDLSYGIEENATAETPVEVKEDKPNTSRAAFGLDDSADIVFTRDFDPFDFATSEKKAAKYASKVSVGSAVTEELDDMTIYQMKADHEPDERERRLMELERKKQEYMRKRQAYQPAQATAPVAHQPVRTEPVYREPVDTIATPATAPVSMTAAHSEPAGVATPTVTPVSQPAPVERPAAPVLGQPYTAKASRPQPIKTVEFTISKEPKTESYAPTESAPVSMTVDKAARVEESAEDVAILIAQRVAQSNPAYARSANDLKTYTKVVSDGDDELYRQLEGISTTASQPATPTETAPTITVEPAPVVSAPVVEPVAESVEFSVQSEPQPVPDVAATPVVQTSYQPVAQPEVTPVTQTSYQPVAQPEVTPVTQTGYQSAVESVSAVVTEPSEPEFKPYTPPTEAIETSPSPEAIEEIKLKAERSMLPPTPEAVFSNAPAVEETAPTVENASAPKTDTEASAEIDFAPVDDEPIQENVITDESSAEPIFSVVDEEKETAPSESQDEEDKAVEISFDDADDDEEEDDGEGTKTDEEEGFEDEGEIPPEEQNPDVIRMRQMFNCLDPIENHVASMPAAESKAEVVVPAEATAVESAPIQSAPVRNTPVDNSPAQAIPVEESADEPPFDGAVEVKSITAASASSALVPVDEKKAEKEKKKKPDYSDYQFPPLDFLKKEDENRDENIQAEIQENADKLIETLASFGVTASIKGVDRGPRITRYEVVPAKGVKVSSILNLQDDIALNLAAGSIRMEAPIPGKSAVGIEIPNKSSSIVRLRDLLETPDFESEKSKTFVCIGRDVAGQPVFGDLAKMPHLLIAGATGMGKSVCINSLLISVLYKARPDEVKLIMIDPKQVEFTMYNGIPHLLVPVVSDAKQAAGSLMWAVEEMERRYNLLNALYVRSVDAYNEKVTADPSLGEFLPKIIIVIDEFADLMLQVKDPVEQLVTRIAQKARAAGIHLVIGTQRPSVNVITGVIKANVPSRISCKVMSNVDSKTVLDSAGAEKLLDKGDALYAPAGSPKPHRLQCAFVADGEVEKIMKYLQQFSNGDSYDASVMEDIERAAQKCSKKGSGADRDDGDRDDGSGEGYLNDRQFLDAVEIAVNTRKISTSLIQRKLSIGYGKAAKFIDIMEDMGIVGEANGQRPREVLLTPDEWREKLSRTSID